MARSRLENSATRVVEEATKLRGLREIDGDDTASREG